MPRRRKFCVINCENSTAWTPIDFTEMFVSHLGKNGNASNASGDKGNDDEGDDEEEGEGEEEWMGINVAKGEAVPTAADGYHGIVITGSRFNVRDRADLPWFEPVCDLVRHASAHGTPNVYGGCFGTQLIAHALGGEVDFNPGTRFVLKAETVALVPEAFHEVLLGRGRGTVGEDSTGNGDGDSDDVGTMKLIVSHGDCVKTLPQTACTVLLGHSPSCAHEMYAAGDVKPNIIGVQSHPEFDYTYAIEQRIWKAVVETKKRLSAAEEEDARESFAAYTDKDAKRLLQYVGRFLRR